MMSALCTFINKTYNKEDGYLNLQNIFGEGFSPLLNKYFVASSRNSYGLVLGKHRYNFHAKCGDLLIYLDDEGLSQYFYKEEARLWQLDELKLLNEFARLLKLNATPIKLDCETDGYYLGTLMLDKMYAIFVCFRVYNFEFSSIPYINDKIEPILLHTLDKLPAKTSKYIAISKGLSFKLSELFSLNANTINGGDIKKLLQFRGTRQKETFNLADLKHNLPKPTWADLTISIIDRDKVNIRIGTYSKTFRYSDIPFFYNSRANNMPKSCWFTLLEFKNEKLAYSEYLKNNIKNLRKFFKLFKIKGDPFKLKTAEDYRGKRKYYCRNFNVKILDEEYIPQNKDQ